MKGALSEASKSKQCITTVLKRVSKLDDLFAMATMLGDIDIKSTQPKSLCHYREHVAPRVVNAALPDHVLSAAVGLLRLHDATHVDGIEVIGIGSYSRESLLAMDSFHFTRTTVCDGLDAVLWLRELGFMKLADRLSAFRPDAEIPELSKPDIKIRSLYSARRDFGFCDALLLAYGSALHREVGSCQTILGPTLSSSGLTLDRATMAKVMSFEQNYAFIIVSSTHRLCIAIDHMLHAITTFDCLGKPEAERLLRSLATSVSTQIEVAYKVKYFVQSSSRSMVRNEDSHDSGLYVCQFMRCVLYDQEPRKLSKKHVQVERARAVETILG